jgi:hypothetical protein
LDEEFPVAITELETVKVFYVFAGAGFFAAVVAR